jgi:hypothetical protein
MHYFFLGVDGLLVKDFNTALCHRFYYIAQ